jgi:hypothetical protein
LPVAHGIDFLMERDGWHGCDAIVTNPPFKLYDEFVRHALTLVPLVCIFGRLMAIEGAGRSDYMDHHCIKVLAGKQRLPMLHRMGWAGNRLKGSPTPYAWFIFTAKPTTTTLLERVTWEPMT